MSWFSFFTGVGKSNKDANPDIAAVGSSSSLSSSNSNNKSNSNGIISSKSTSVTSSGVASGTQTVTATAIAPPQSLIRDNSGGSGGGGDGTLLLKSSTGQRPSLNVAGRQSLLDNIDKGDTCLNCDDGGSRDKANEAKDAKNSSNNSGSTNGSISNSSTTKNAEKAESTVNYDAQKMIGHGAFGAVFLSIIVETGETVAIKKVLQDKRFKNRELQVMKQLQSAPHPYICSLINSFISNGTKQGELYLNLVLEYVPETMYSVIKNYNRLKEPFPQFLVAVYTYQMARAIAHIHGVGICHRDIKPQNLLVDPVNQRLKLCDFGSAKQLIEGEPNIAYICSRFYRAPELIFGATAYTVAVDVWSMGCVFAEMLTGTPTFPGGNSTDQLVEVIKVLGAPTKEQMKEMNPSYQEFKFPRIKAQTFSSLFRPSTSEAAIDLASRMFRYEPVKRPKAIQVCAHSFFDILRSPEVGSSALFIKHMKNAMPDSPAPTKLGTVPLAIGAPNSIVPVDAAPLTKFPVSMFTFTSEELSAYKETTNGGDPSLGLELLLPEALLDLYPELKKKWILPQKDSKEELGLGLKAGGETAVSSDPEGRSNNNSNSSSSDGGGGGGSSSSNSIVGTGSKSNNNNINSDSNVGSDISDINNSDTATGESVYYSISNSTSESNTRTSESNVLVSSISTQQQQQQPIKKEGEEKEKGDTL